MSQKAVPQSLWWLSWFLTYGHACGRASGFDTKGLLTRASRFSHFLLEKDDVYIWLPPLLGCQEAGRGGLAVVLGPGKGPSSEMAAHLPDDQVGLGSKMGASGPFCFLLKTQKKKKSREGNGTSLQYFCLENPMDGEAWWVAVHGVARVGHD